MKQIITTALAVAAALLGQAPPAHADFVFDVCPSGRSGIATTVTSCPFADDVRASYFARPGLFIEAYSPVTGQVYDMECNSNTVATLNIGRRLAVTCNGGNDAVVVFW